MLVVCMYYTAHRNVNRAPGPVPRGMLLAAQSYSHTDVLCHWSFWPPVSKRGTLAGGPPLPAPPNRAARPVRAPSSHRARPSRSSSARAAAPAGEPPSSLRPLCGQHCRRARHPTERKMPAHWSVKPRCGPRRRCTVRACGTSEPSGGSSSALRFDMAPEQRRGRESRRRAGQPGGARQGALLPSRLTAGVAEEEEGSPGRWLQKGGHRRQSDSLGASSR